MAHLRKKIITIICGIFFSVIILELGMRLGGFIFLSLQEYRNIVSAQKKGSYEILCLGESTTAGQYPHFLEDILNHSSAGIKFSVIDKGVAGTNTAAILSTLENNLNKYQPNVVIAMMGFNDRYVQYYKNIPEANSSLFQHCRLYRFIRLMSVHIINKLKKKDIYGAEKDVLDFENDNELKKTEIANDEKLFNGSIRLFKKAIELSPKNDWAYFGLGWVYRKQGKFLEADQLFKKAIELNSQNESVYAKVYGLAGKFSEPKEVFRKIIELDPQAVGAYCALGIICYKHGKISEAEQLYKKVIELDPKNDWAYFGLGWVYSDQGKLPEAAVLLKKALELNPKNDWAYIILGDVYLSQNRSFEAEQLFKKAVELNPKEDIWAYQRLGTFLFQVQSRYSEAEELFYKAMELAPKLDRIYVLLGMVYQKQGKLFEAEQLYEKATELNYENDIAYRALESLYKEMNNKEFVKGYNKKADKLGSDEYSPTAVINYHKLKEVLDKRGIGLICVQYPMRNIASLKKVFAGYYGVIFVDNEKIFKKAVSEATYWEYFRDRYAGDFGHCTDKGNRLLAENIANIILKEYFKK